MAGGRRADAPWSFTRSCEGRDCFGLRGKDVRDIHALPHSHSASHISTHGKAVCWLWRCASDEKPLDAELSACRRAISATRDLRRRERTAAEASALSRAAELSFAMCAALRLGSPMARGARPSIGVCASWTRKATRGCAFGAAPARRRRSGRAAWVCACFARCACGGSPRWPAPCRTCWRRHERELHEGVSRDPPAQCGPCMAGTDAARTAEVLELAPGITSCNATILPLPLR